MLRGLTSGSIHGLFSSINRSLDPPDIPLSNTDFVFQSYHLQEAPNPLFSTSCHLRVLTHHPPPHHPSLSTSFLDLIVGCMDHGTGGPPPVDHGSHEQRCLCHQSKDVNPGTPSQANFGGLQRCPDPRPANSGLQDAIAALRHLRLSLCRAKRLRLFRARREQVGPPPPYDGPNRAVVEAEVTGV